MEKVNLQSADESPYGNHHPERIGSSVAASLCEAPG
jgi:hypothetical protein